MLPSAADCSRALSTRDARFDGVFFTGVTSTGIYCRPVCPARTPRADRCRFFALAAEASQAGFRPCLRCRPELAPGLSPLEAVPRLVREALLRIEAGALNEGSIEQLARALGTSSRHLHRSFVRELGVAPVELAQTRRLLLAKQLLTETTLPMTEVAFASGFQSVRRFNALFRDRLRLDPRGLRRVSADRPSGLRTLKPAGATMKLALAFRPPFAWEQLLAFLGARAIPGVEVVEGGTYLRVVRLGAAAGLVSVGPPKGNTLPLELSHSLLPVLVPLLARMRALFDLDARPHELAQALCEDPRLAMRLEEAPGLRVPGAFDGFELAVRALLGQQVSVKAATTLAGRLVLALGEPVDTGDPRLSRSFPMASTVAKTAPRTLSRLGILPARAETIVRLARELDAGRLVLTPGADAPRTIAQLESLAGIGPWTSHYIALRALRYPDAFPHGDLWLRRAIGAPTARALLHESERWRPFRALAALLLWTVPTLPSRRRTA